LRHKYDVIFLPLHREIGEVIASEVYWALNTFEMIAKEYQSCAYVGRISKNGLKSLGKLSNKIHSFRIDSSRTVINDLVFYLLIFGSGLKNIFSAKIWHHYGSFGYMKGFNPAFFLPKFGKKYVLGPILYPSNDPPDTAVKLGFVRYQHSYGKLASLLFSLLHKLTLFRSDIIIFDSDDTKGIYLNRFKFLNRKIIRIIPGGGLLDKDFHCYPNAFKEHIPILGIASNLIKRKNIDKLIEAIASANLHVSLKIAGDGPERENIISLVKQLHLNEKVEFLRRIDHSDISSFFNAIDVYVALDNVPTEVKISVQEAMMCGCAVISGESKVKDLVIKKEWGVIVNPNSVSDIGKAINIIYNNSNDLLKMKMNAKLYADEHFSEKAIVNKYKQTYDEVLFNI